MSDTRIPVTVLTGYLGAGKTTLLNRILKEDHGHRWAVIVNEFGEVGIDHELIMHGDEELFEMNNGCICCTVRGDLIRTLHGLLARPLAFDALIVETTGLADPGPVAQTFFVDPLLRERLRLDSITTLVDAHHITARLADSREAVEQIALADQIVLNKTDLASEQQLQALERQLRRINPMATTHRALRSDVPLDQVLGRGGFDLDRIMALDAGHVHDEHCRHEHEHHHVHDSSITSLSLSSTQPMDAARVQRWLTELVATKGADILRAKGVIDIAGDERRMVFQSVHMILEGDWQRPWRADETRHSRLVFIGRHLNEHELRAGFEACVHSENEATS